MLYCFFLISVCGPVTDGLDPHGIYILDAADDGVGATATLRCDSGYSITNGDTIQISCQSDGTSDPIWPTPTQMCKVNGKTLSLLYIYYLYS